MNRLRAARTCGRDDGGDIRVRIARAFFAERDRFVAREHVRRAGVRADVHRDAGDAEALARACDAQHDLSAVGDQHLVEHRPGVLPALAQHFQPPAPRRRDA